MEALALYALCTASLFYLGSRAVITSFLWSRYPAKIASFMDCSACSGTWYGALVGYLGGYHLGLPFMGLPGDSPATVAAVALASMTWTPIVAGLVQRGFESVGSAVAADDDWQPMEQVEIGPPERVSAEDVFRPRRADVEEHLRRSVAGVITPREIPVVRPKDDDGPGAA